MAFPAGEVERHVVPEPGSQPAGEQADASSVAVSAGKKVGVRSETIVADDDDQAIVDHLRRDRHGSAFRLRRDPVFDGVLDKQLEREERHGTTEARIIDPLDEVQARAEAKLLDLDVVLDEGEFVATGTIMSAWSNRSS